MSPSLPITQRRLSTSNVSGDPPRMTCLIASALRFAGPSMVCSSTKSVAPADEAAPTIGNATRYRLMPHAFMTMSSLFFVSSATVTSVREQH